MKVKSCCSTNISPYRAGLEIGEKLAGIQPEVIFLFASIHYQGSPELTEAIYDSLDSLPVIIGSTGDGFYETQTVAETGVSALAINSEGSVRWHLATESVAKQSPTDAARQCMNRLATACGNTPPALYFLSCDFRMDTTELMDSLLEATDRPIIGGSAGDDFQFLKSYVYANRDVSENSIAILAAEGPLRYNIFVSNDMLPVGNPGTITDCHDLSICSIDGQPAASFIVQETGSSVNTGNQGTLTLRLSDPSRQENRLRSLLLPDGTEKSGTVHLFGGVHPGDTAQLCYMSADKIIEDITKTCDKIATLPYTPHAALMISCAGRKRVLGPQLSEEVNALRKACPDLSAIAGLSSFGEFGPLTIPDGYTRSLFHNMTCVILVLGEGSSS